MRIVILLFLLLPSLVLLGQRNDNPLSDLTFKERLYFGGDITVAVSGSATVIGAAPMLGYRITPDWSAGLGVSAYYFNVRGPFNFATSFYGGNLFSRYLITDNIFVQSEFHAVNTEVAFVTVDEVVRTREWLPLFYVGGGYRQPVGARGFVSVTVLYDVIDDPNSPYPNPTIRGGFSFGFN